MPNNEPNPATKPTAGEIREMLTMIQDWRVNYFLTDPPQAYTRTWEIENGALKTDLDLLVGGWVWFDSIKGQSHVARGSYRIAHRLLDSSSGVSDVYLYGLEDLEGISQTFTATLRPQNVPRGVVALIGDMVKYYHENPPSRVISESVSGFYSVQFARSAVEDGGMPAGEFEIFGQRIKKMVPLSMFTGIPSR